MKILLLILSSVTALGLLAPVAGYFGSLMDKSQTPLVLGIPIVLASIAGLNILFCSVATHKMKRPIK
jgi:hypothetical protein